MVNEHTSPVSPTQCNGNLISMKRYVVNNKPANCLELTLTANMVFLSV